MTTTTSLDRIRDFPIESREITKYFLKELGEIVERSEAEPELAHWYHFVPCAGVRYYTYHTAPSPVEPISAPRGG